MRPFLRIAWLATNAATEALGQSEPHMPAVRAYVEPIAQLLGPGTCQAYQLVQGGRVTREIRLRRKRLGRDLDVGDLYRILPDCIVMTEFDSWDAALEFEETLSVKWAHATSELGRAAPTVVARGLYREIARVEGVENARVPGLAPAIQLGTFEMRSSDDEWAMNDYYRTHRFPSFSTIKGGVRARRFQSVCGGPARTSVLYEFTSLQDRIDHFEVIEAEDHDEGSPTVAVGTMHPPMSPGIGTALAIG